MVDDNMSNFKLQHCPVVLILYFRFYTRFALYMFLTIE